MARDLVERAASVKDEDEMSLTAFESKKRTKRTIATATKKKVEKTTKLNTAEATLWGAILYRCFNRLSTFSRWAAVKTLSAEKKITSSMYEKAVHGPKGERDETIHAIAASGVTLRGRSGLRDKWGADFCRKQMEPSNSKKMLCESILPLPSELDDFKIFTDWEKMEQGRGVMTGEHQVQAYDKVFKMLKSLVVKNCSLLKKMSKVIMKTDSAKVVLNELKALDTIGEFFSWQIFSDLACVQHYCQLFPENTVLPSSVVVDSRYNYAWFGPGARKGAKMIFGEVAKQLENNNNVPQEETIERAVIIRNEFEAALDRTNLTANWADRAGGRMYDLETIEHSLCGFYGVMHNLNVNVLLADDKAYKLMEGIAEVLDCAWPPGGSDKSASKKIVQRQGMGSWQPHPCTDLERLDLIKMCEEFKSTT